MELEVYARIMVELAAAEGERASVLARHGLDEDSWHQIDDAFQDRLSEAMDTYDGDGVPELVARYAKAYEDAQREGGPVMSIETFARVMKILEATSDLRAALARSGTTLSEYVRATEHYSRRFAHEPELAEAYEEALRSG